MKKCSNSKEVMIVGTRISLRSNNKTQENKGTKQISNENPFEIVILLFFNLSYILNLIQMEGIIFCSGQLYFT